LINAAFILGLSETGLGVGRSLGQAGIKTYGFDSKRCVGFYSKYIQSYICPHPTFREQEFITFIIDFKSKFIEKGILFITSDDFLSTISRNRLQLEPHFLFSLPTEKLISIITNKNEYKKLTELSGILIPKTFFIETIEQIDELKLSLPYPVFIKPADVNDWRQKIGSSKKGLVANDSNSLTKHILKFHKMDIKTIVQEIIDGPDSNIISYCAYYSTKSNPICEFVFQKIRQHPAHFGIGSAVESINSDEILEVGRKLFKAIGFVGVGEAEFKFDEKNKVFKLIEINPRYWQQNYLTSVCGINFPLIDYYNSTGLQTDINLSYRTRVKWINRYLDFGSFIDYYKEHSLTYRQWRRSLWGEKVYSDFTWDDPIPVLYEVILSGKIFILPWIFLRKIFKK